MSRAIDRDIARSTCTKSHTASCQHLKARTSDECSMDTAAHFLIESLDAIPVAYSTHMVKLCIDKECKYQSQEEIKDKLISARSQS